MPNSLVGIALLVLGCFQTVASDQLTLKKEQMMHNKKIEHMGTIKPRKAAEEKAAASLKVGLMHELSDLGTADAKHDAGLHPHHNVGADENDPLLFRHRYHGHHAETNKLIYYQYEARRHGHVVMLADLDVVACTAKLSVDHRSLASPFALTLSIDKLDAADLRNGSIVVGKLRCGTGTGGSVWEQAIRERVVENPEVLDKVRGHVLVKLVTLPASFHECFEHSQLEYFHGHREKLHTARGARAKSLIQSGHVVSANSFASTEEVLRDAYGVDANVAIGSPVPAPVVVAMNGSNIMSHRRLQKTITLTGWNCNTELSSSGVCSNTCSAYSDDGECDDGGPGSEFTECRFGEDCADCGTRTLTHQVENMNSRSNCFWGQDGTTHPSLKVGNTYKLIWEISTTSTTAQIEVWEDNDYMDSKCVAFPTFTATTGTNSKDVLITDFRELDCAQSDWGFNEFYLYIKTDAGEEFQSTKFRLLFDKGLNNENLPDLSTPLKFGGESWGLELTCTDCHIGGEADVHILVRTTETNPFDESWSWGDIDIDGQVAMSAQAWLGYEKTFGSEPQLDVCLHPVCADLTFAGVGVKVGLIFKFTASASLNFNIAANVTYERSIKASGLLALHTKGEEYRHEVNDFNIIEDGNDVSQPASSQINLDAQVSMTLAPQFYLGLFASASTVAEAEVYVRLQASFKARARLQFRTAINAPVDVFQALTTCNESFVGCNGMCSEAHDTQIDAFLDLILDAGIKLYASVTWIDIGHWDSSSTFGSEDEIEISLDLGWTWHIGSWCFYLFPPSPPPPPSLGYATGTGTVSNTVSMEVVAAGSVSDFTAEMTMAIKEKIATRTGVAPTAIKMTISAASVKLSFDIEMPDETTTTSALSVLQSVFSSPEAASIFLTTSAGSVYVEEITMAPVAIEQSFSSAGNRDTDTQMLIIIAASVGGATLLTGFCLCYFRQRKKRKSNSLSTSKAIDSKPADAEMMPVRV